MPRRDLCKRADNEACDSETTQSRGLFSSNAYDNASDCDEYSCQFDSVDTNGGQSMHDDPQTPPEASLAPSTSRLLLDVHVVYHPSYQVPVLYFRLRLPGGSPLTTWPQVLRALPSLAAHIGGRHPEDCEELVDTRGPGRHTVVTHEEHILQGNPWFLLHPCQTPTLMSLLLSEGFGSPRGICDSTQSSSKDTLSFGIRYLLAWYSIVAPVINLTAVPVPVRCGNQVQPLEA